MSIASSAVAEPAVAEARRVRQDRSPPQVRVVLALPDRMSTAARADQPRPF